MKLKLIEINSVTIDDICNIALIVSWRFIEEEEEHQSKFSGEKWGERRLYK